MKLTRKQITEGLKSYPIETLLLGATSSKEKRLTAKQKAFAEEVAKGNTKAGAYRKSYNSKAKPKVQSEEGQRLAKDPAIAMQIEAFRVALEAQKYQTPAHLRALAIHKITEKALSEDTPPAQQLKALELLGKITEVALFTERREIVQTSNSEEMKAKLLNSIRLAISSQNAETIETDQAEQLLAELSGVRPDDEQSPDHEREDEAPDAGQTLDPEPPAPSQNNIEPTPPTPDPQNWAYADTSPLHSIPLTKSPEDSVPNPVTEGSVTPVTPENVEKSTPCVSSSSNPMLSRGEG